MKHSVIVKIAFMFSIGLPSFTFASNDKHCDIAVQAYIDHQLQDQYFQQKQAVFRSNFQEKV